LTKAKNSFRPGHIADNVGDASIKTLQKINCYFGRNSDSSTALPQKPLMQEVGGNRSGKFKVMCEI
jgi:hypothetical protein